MFDSITARAAASASQPQSRRAVEDPRGPHPTPPHHRGPCRAHFPPLEAALTAAVTQPRRGLGGRPSWRSRPRSRAGEAPQGQLGGRDRSFFSSSKSPGKLAVAAAPLLRGDLAAARPSRSHTPVLRPPARPTQTPELSVFTHREGVPRRSLTPQVAGARPNDYSRKLLSVPVQRAAAAARRVLNASPSIRRARPRPTPRLLQKPRPQRPALAKLHPRQAI